MEREVHVSLDPDNPTGFAGLPGAWETILMYSGIMRDEAMANPEAVIDVLNFSKKAEGKRASVDRALPPIYLERMNTPSMTSFDERSDGFLSDELTSQSSGNSGIVQLGRMSFGGEEVMKVRRRSSQYNLRSHLGPLPPIPSSAISHVRRSEPVKIKEIVGPGEPSTDVMENLIGSERKVDLPDGIPDDLVADFREDDPFMLFTRMEQIGQGSCGNVYRAVDKNGRFVALKKVKPESSRDWKLYKFEVQVMQDQYKSDNLVDCYDAFRSGNELWIVMEYVSAGTLADLLSEQRGAEFQRSQQAQAEGAGEVAGGRKMEENVIAYICREVLRGLESLHSIRRVHRDIKGDNILLDMDGSVKIADFGFCAELSRGSGKRNTVVGTPYWMAPEVIRGANYDCKVDLWSTGILALECAEGKPPHLDASPIRAMFLIATQGAPELSEAAKWSETMREFIGLCCKVKPEERRSAEEMLQHEFIEGACSQADAAGFFAEACDLRFRKRRERRTRGFSNYQFQTER
ncbi:Serine/threonine-protein kinase [Chondrus crispus]|uniref:Serine/threonine-protein kinase n=1 Tax=Chondrus crispus TaxID=2769 RepID=R7QAK5_CHOCR|nr:Serine/threonine-protein kinase [Chondrus crispus]CDF35532.1 Serine/threonine-protein kinase [Chondrus crispus]|eukprot:XP_005715351.1 Serine/threonine-protein kinase [Chondrus crispus]